MALSRGVVTFDALADSGRVALMRLITLLESHALQTLMITLCDSLSLAYECITQDYIILLWQLHYMAGNGILK